MATLNGSALGSTGNYGSADGVLIIAHGSASGVVGVSGSASGIVVAGVHITQAGAHLDTDGIVPAQVTQGGVAIDVARIVPVYDTQTGAHIDVDRLVPVDLTATGSLLDVDRIVPAQLSTVGLHVDARLQRRRTLTMCWEFHVYNRAGVYLAYLDNAFDKSYLTQLWDVGGGSFKLPTSDPKATVTNLRVGNIVKVRYANRDLGAWLMENIATTYVDTGEGAARIVTVSGRGLIASLQKALIYPTDLNDPATTEREYVDTAKAKILLDFYEEFVARGGGIFTTGWTDTHDSDSNAWTDQISLNFKAGQTVLDVLRQLQGFGLEVVAKPDKTLDAYISYGSDLSSSVPFRYGQNMLSCTTLVQGSDIANVVLGEANDLLDEETDATSITTYGRQEAYLPVRNTDTATVLDDATDLFLDSFAQPPNSIALQVATFPDYPLLDYDIGDYVRVVVPPDIDESYRILAIAMQEGSGPCDLRVTLELNSQAAEYLARLQRAMNASLASIKPDQAAASGIASTSPTGETPSLSLNDLTNVNIGSAADNDVLAYDTATSKWIDQSATEAGLTPATLTTKGDLLTWGTAHERLAVGTVGQVLTVSSGTIPAWEDPTGGSGDVATDTIWDAKGDLVVGTASNAAARLAVGTNDYVLTADDSAPLGVKWAAVSGGTAGGSMATDALWNAAGDLAYATADNAGTVLPIGMVGQVLTVSSGTVPAWANTTGASLRRTSTQNISANTDTPIQWDTEDVDTGGYFTSGSNTRLTVPAAGWYVFNATVNWAGGGTRYVHLKIDNTTFAATQSAPNTLNDWRANVTLVRYLNASSYVEVVVFSVTSSTSIDDGNFDVVRIL